MGTAASEGHRPGHPYIQALLAAQVPVDQVVLQAEAVGFAPEDLRALAATLVPPGRSGRPMAALLLLLGAAADWRPFLAEGLRLGTRLLEPLLHPACSELDGLVRILDESAWAALRASALLRLGHPLPPELRIAGAEARALLLPWLERDRALVLDGVELTGFASRARAWSQVQVGALVLADGAGPQTLGHGAGEPCRDPGGARSTRLHRVRRLRSLEGLQAVDVLVATACPDLERLDGAPPVTVLKGCPGIREVRSGPRSLLLHLEDCPRLRSIAPAGPREDFWCGQAAPAWRTLVLSGCAALRELPAALNVTGRMILRGMGPIHQWPADFRVGGDLLLRDCARIEELPPLEVRGCLRVEGASGLRRLAAGTIVGRHLDLRACRQLEGVPRGVKVGGALYLPAHLHRQGTVFEPATPLLELPADPYPPLRDLLLGLCFPGLARPAERLAGRDRAEAALDGLRRELKANPRIEADLLWTASEVWRELAEELWAEAHPGCCDWSEPGDDLPLAWFRGLLWSA